MIKTVLQTLRRFENVWLYIGFLIVAGFLAASRGCSQEFFTVLFFPAMIPVLLSVVMLLFCAYRGANGRILLLVLIMLALAGLMRAVFWTSYPELFEGSKLTIPDYLLVQIVMFAVMLIYPMRTSWKNQRIFEILAGRKCTLAMLILIAVMYALLLLSGDSYSGVRAWFTIGGFSIQLTEFIKLLFIICLAAMMSRDEKAPLAILFYIVNAVLMGAVISEFGTVMVMTFVFIFFLFIFPQKKGLYFVVSLIALLIVVAAMGFLRMSSREYDYALEKSDPRVFAAKFAGTLYDYAMDTPEDVVTMDILGEMVNKSLSAMDTEKQAEFGRAFHSISNQIADGQLKLSDFAEARDSDILEKVSEIVDAKKENGIGPETAAALTKVIEKYPAVSALARLCEDDGFRSSYIMQFCREEFYSTGMLYRSAPSGFRHNIARKGMGAYSKIVERIVLPNEALCSYFGFKSEVPFQLAAAQSAMQVGGIAGAKKHEFYYVPVMESDMIFSEMVSIYGFSMGFFVILLFMILFREGMKEAIALRGKPFHRGLALGITLMIFVQALIIIAGNLNLFPLTGITLPFIADGTISMVVFAFMVGILLAVSYVPIVEENAANGTGKGSWKAMPGRVVDTVKGNLWTKSHHKRRDEWEEEEEETEEEELAAEEEKRQEEQETVRQRDTGRKTEKKRGTKYTNWD